MVSHTAPARTAAPPTPIPIFCHVFICAGAPVRLLGRILHLTLVLRRNALQCYPVADYTSRHIADGGQQSNDLRSVFAGEAQTLPAQAGARTAPHTTLNFTVISKRNKAICWRCPIGLDNGGVALVSNDTATRLEYAIGRKRSPAQDTTEEFRARRPELRACSLSRHKDI